MSATTRIAINGRRGRMGSAIAALCEEDPSVELICGIDAGEPWPPGVGFDVLIDFSTPDAAASALVLAIAQGAAFVSGTTGLEDVFFHALERASESIPVLHAANMSVGVTVLRHLVAEAARMLPKSFDTEIVELHHRRKVDAPSGTALALIESINAGRDQQSPQHGARLQRVGQVGARQQGEIGVMALRGGTVAGDHTVFFLGDDERIELRHQAGDRRIFARGALQAARWIHGRPAGRYTMQTVLGI